jgi:hypothetical protein
MDIMELGAIGELVGGIAVIASLIYVGLQVRQANRQARDEAARGVANQFDRYIETIVADPDVRAAWVIATGGTHGGPMRNPRSLDPDQLSLVAMVLYRALHQIHSHYRAWVAGTLDDDQWSKVSPLANEGAHTLALFNPTRTRWWLSPETRNARNRKDSGRFNW